MPASRFSLAESLRENIQSETRPKLDLFSEEPVPLNVFLHDKKYIGQPDLELGKYQYDLIRHMEQIYYIDLYPEMVETFGEYWTPVRYVNRLNIQYGKGSGKDFMVQLAFARISYLLLCLKNPQRYYRLSQQSDIHLLNVAMNAAQARRAFFRPLGSLLKNSRWFDDKISGEISDQSTKIILDKQVELISGHSLAENFEGLSPIAVVLDEISGFQSEALKASKGIVESARSAEATYNIVSSSAATRFPESHKVAAISYPRYIHDPIQNLCDQGNADIEANGDSSIYYVDGPRATWEVNPRYKDYEYITIPETNIPVPNLPVILENYRRDAAEARAKFECRPERASNRYIRNDSAIAASFPKQDENWIEPLQISYYWGVDAEGAAAEGSYELASIPNWQVSYDFGPSLRPMEGCIYGIHFDLAITADRAGMAMCHVKNWERREHVIGDNPEKGNYQVDDRPVVKVDFATYFEADMQAQTDDGVVHPREIQLRWARNLVRELRRRGFPIGIVTFDSYQSEDSIQSLIAMGVPADKLSMDRTTVPYATLRDVMYDNRLEGYHNEILQIELESLNLLPSGKIDHPPGGSKDIADAVCGAVVDAIELGGSEGEEPEEIDVNQDYGGDVNGNIFGPDAFWGNIDLRVSEDDFKFSF